MAETPDAHRGHLMEPALVKALVQVRARGQALVRLQAGGGVQARVQVQAHAEQLEV